MTAGEWTLTLQHMALWGPGILILVGAWKLLTMFLAMVKEPPRFVGEFIAAQQSQAVAMTQMATAVQTIATRQDALEQIRMQKLDEVLVGQQLILAKVEALERR